jgi:peroxiredoxin
MGLKSQIWSPEASEAPAIELPVGRGGTWALQHFRGQPVVLAFYPADWEPVSADQLRSYNEVLPEIRWLGAELVGASVDSVWCHEAFTRDLLLHFRLLSDFHPRGGAAQAYGVYLPRKGFSARAIFVIDAMGLIRWHYRGAFEVNPGVHGILTALEAPAQEQASTERDKPI